MHFIPNLCYIRTSDVIDLYFIQTKSDPSLSIKFNVAYYLLTYSKVDAWLYNTRDRYSKEGDGVFTS